MKYSKEEVVSALARRFPEADAGPSGIWGFVNAGWEGDVDDNGLVAWVEAWRESVTQSDEE